MKSVSGFTFIELLVAMAIFSVLSLIAYGGLNNIIHTAEVVEIQADRLRQLQIFMSIIEKDMLHLAPRSVRDEFGDPEPAMKIPGAGLRLMDFTRAGWSNPLRQQRSELQRVGYALKEDKIVRVSFVQLDRAPGTEPLEQVLLDKVQDVQIRALDRSREWQNVWPPLTATSVSSTPSGTLVDRPYALELQLDLKDWGSIRRLLLANDG